jgi:hypothetical protein
MPDRQRLTWFLVLVLVVLLPTAQALVGGDDGGGVTALRALRLRLMILALVCCLMPTIVPALALANTDDRPIVVLRIDDGQTSWLTPYNGLGGVNGLTYGKSKHIPITWAVITHLASLGTSLSWAQIKDYLDTCGGEAASHSVNHLPMSTQQDYINEVINSKAAIQANLPGYSCNTFLQPGDWTADAYMDSFTKLDNPIGQAIQNTYAQSMAYLGGGGWNIGNNYYHYGLTHSSGIDYGATSIPTMNAVLDTVANTPGEICVILGHGVQETGQTGTYRIPADLLKATMDKLADLRDQGKIRLMSLNDAYHTTFSPGLNRVPDPGFELASSIYNSWALFGTAQVTGPGGVDDSRYGSMPDTSAWFKSWSTLQPGRFELNWYQKVLTGKQNTGLIVGTGSINQNAVAQQSGIYSALFSNVSPSSWEKKTALLLVPERLNITALTFEPMPGAGYGIDNVSVVSAPIDAGVSPSASTVTPSPGQGTISWHTPNDPSVVSVVVRYNYATHPMTPTSGSSFCGVTAHPNEVQQVTAPVNWAGLTYGYFSVFGVKADSSFTPPDLVVVKIDRTAPTTPAVILVIDSDGTIHANWSSSAPNSGIVQYQYAVGSSPGNDAIQHWTLTTNTTATALTSPPTSTTYVSVKAENVFGFWSYVGSAYVQPTTVSLAAAYAQSDGQLLSVSGTVTAVFSDCCYIEKSDRSRALKIVGDVSSIHQGDYITVQGSMATSKGERCMTMH